MADDPYANREALGRMVLNAAKAAVHDDSDPNLQRINAILACEAFVADLVDHGCMIRRIPTRTPVQKVNTPRSNTNKEK
jgi:hypothetical protein